MSNPWPASWNVEDKGDHEHIFVQGKLHFMEVCSVAGCRLARYSPVWIAAMKRIITRPAHQVSGSTNDT